MGATVRHWYLRNIRTSCLATSEFDVFILIGTREPSLIDNISPGLDDYLISNEQAVMRYLDDNLTQQHFLYSSEV